MAYDFEGRQIPPKGLLKTDIRTAATYLYIGHGADISSLLTERNRAEVLPVRLVDHWASAQHSSLQRNSLSSTFIYISDVREVAV